MGARTQGGKAESECWMQEAQAMLSQAAEVAKEQQEAMQTEVADADEVVSATEHPRGTIVLHSVFIDKHDHFL